MPPMRHYPNTIYTAVLYRGRAHYGMRQLRFASEISIKENIMFKRIWDYIIALYLLVKIAITKIFNNRRLSPEGYEMLKFLYRYAFTTLTEEQFTYADYLKYNTIVELYEIAKDKGFDGDFSEFILQTAYTMLQWRGSSKALSELDIPEEEIIKNKIIPEPKNKNN